MQYLGEFWLQLLLHRYWPLQQSVLLAQACLLREHLGAAADCSGALAKQPQHLPLAAVQLTVKDLHGMLCIT